ncbi:sensor histidine kinase [Clostridium sp.]|uniref:sensor histidine kinase n=1 Tax=Clostridium sp. TaxID=1506 RepID=UPI003F3CC4AC
MLDIKLIKNKNLLVLVVCLCMSVIGYKIDNLYYRYKEFVSVDFYNTYGVEADIAFISDNSVYAVAGDDASESMLTRRSGSRKLISNNVLMKIFVINNDSKEVYSNDIFDFDKYMKSVKNYPYVYEINYKQNTMYLLRDNEKIRVSMKDYGNLAQRRKEDVTTYIALPDKYAIQDMKYINENEPLYSSYNWYMNEIKDISIAIFLKIIAIAIILLNLILCILTVKKRDGKVKIRNVFKNVVLIMLGLLFSLIFAMRYGRSNLYPIVNTCLLYISYYYAGIFLRHNNEDELYRKVPLLKLISEIKIKNIKVKNIYVIVFIITVQIIVFIILYKMNGAYGVIYPDYIFILLWSLIIVLNVLLLWIILNKIDNIEKIKTGIKEIKKGNLDYKIEIKKDNLLDDMVNNINEIGETINIAVEERLKSERMKNELITNVSHDLKTPLTAIINYISLMQKEDIQPEHIKDYVQVLDKRSQRLKTLIEDLFEASKIGSNNIELNLEPNDINQLLAQTLVEMEEYIEESKLDFIINVPEYEVYTLADGKNTFRVFENIISNILKYSLEGTRVYIDLEDKNDKVNITFKNVSKYQLNFDPNEITERFTRGDLSRNTEGSGLGLAIAKGFVEAQGGSLKVDIIGDLFIVKVELNLIKN